MFAQMALITIRLIKYRVKKVRFWVESEKNLGKSLKFAQILTFLLVV